MKVEKLKGIVKTYLNVCIFSDEFNESFEAG